MKELQSLEKERFQLLKQTVTDSMMVCLTAGLALREIKEREFWKSEFATWEEFINHYWGWTLRYVNQLMLDAKTINSVPEAQRKLLTSGATIREIGRLPESLRGPIIDLASDGGKKKVTAEAIRQAKPKSTPPPRPGKKGSNPPPRPAKKGATQKKQEAPKLPKDATGCDIPEEVQELWNKGGEAKELIFYVNATLAAVEKKQAFSDPLFVTLDFADTIAKLRQVRENLKEALPYAVCASCGGKTPTDCTACKGRGFVSEFFWNTCVPADLKSLRTPKQ